MAKNKPTEHADVMEKLAEALERLLPHKFVGTDEALKVAGEAGVFPDDFADKLADRAKRDLVRRVLRSKKGPDRFPLFANIVQPDAHGHERRVYMAEKYMQPDDYKQVC